MGLGEPHGRLQTAFLAGLCPHPDRAVLLQASNQPNDCDGPKQPETCIFLGPYGAWFDFQW